jgi:hypothetical protein
MKGIRGTGTGKAQHVGPEKKFIPFDGPVFFRG